MKLLIFLLLGLTLLSQDIETQEDVSTLKMREEWLQQKQDIEKLNKILQAYQNKFFNCDVQLTMIQATKQ